MSFKKLEQGSDSSTPFRCQPAGHLAQSLSPFASRIVPPFYFHPLAQASLARNENKKAPQLTLRGFVEGKGFEPSVSLRPTHAFQACSLNHSDTPLDESVGLQK